MDQEKDQSPTATAFHTKGIWIGEKDRHVWGIAYMFGDFLAFLRALPEAAKERGGYGVWRVKTLG
jgi:hypothetical protein